MSSTERSATTMDIHQILGNLPHRYPFLLVDRVLECRPGESIVCIKNVTINEPFFTGHFPQRAIMPGVLIIESMAQACGLLAFKTRENEPEGIQAPGESSLFFLVGVDDARFKRPVEPGDTLTLRAALRRSVRGIWIFDTEARVGEALVARADIRCTMKDI